MRGRKLFSINEQILDKVADFVYTEGTVSKNEIHKKFGYDTRTITKIVTELVKRNIVIIGLDKWIGAHKTECSRIAIMPA